jgi:hypothetical protein
MDKIDKAAARQDKCAAHDKCASRDKKDKCAFYRPSGLLSILSSRVAASSPAGHLSREAHSTIQQLNS